MMYKYAGIALLVAVSGYSGRLFFEGYKQRYDYLSSVLKFMEEIKSQIEYFNSPISKICTEYKDERLAEFLITAGNESINAAFKKHYGKLYLSTEELEIFGRFTEGIGRGTSEEQIRFCEHYINSIKKIHGRMADELPKNRKLCSSLGLMAGILVAILLL
jgi:stage III sporulation protein AB